MEFSSEEQAVLSESICIDDAVLAKRIKSCSRSMVVCGCIGLFGIVVEVFGGSLSGAGGWSSIIFGAVFLTLASCCRAYFRFQRAAFSVIRKLHREE